MLVYTPSNFGGGGGANAPLAPFQKKQYYQQGKNHFCEMERDDHFIVSPS